MKRYLTASAITVGLLMALVSTEPMAQISTAAKSSCKVKMDCDKPYNDAIKDAAARNKACKDALEKRDYRGRFACDDTQRHDRQAADDERRHCRAEEKISEKECRDKEKCDKNPKDKKCKSPS